MAVPDSFAGALMGSRAWRGHVTPPTVVHPPLQRRAAFVPRHSTPTSSRANRFLRNSKVHTANITTQASTERCHSLPYRLRYGMVWALEQRTMLFRQLHGETFRLLAPCDLEMDMNKPSATA
ncbi:hypothetical protein HBI56_115490 [Parastagonospora nodorum]|nr:hypothetical protein HBH56_196350 [Parastagonospora nodorum]KAH3976380.1 hypothetical protein HBH52_119200 [Parastagonospora nodorum]KAH4026529.1 hypothetical protein HBI13_063420 [Parastagonospora nodorum]KAH4068135.1 hypothetical protein HBH50_123020 [Parastagonospora nodorum]KAH4131508.1 hypothetical protein HBH45_193290 [Parastagonospora nodorum]